MRWLRPGQPDPESVDGIAAFREFLDDYREHDGMLEARICNICGCIVAKDDMALHRSRCVR